MKVSSVEKIFDTTGCPKKRTFRMAQSQVAGTSCVRKQIFDRFLLRLSLIKPFQDIFMVKFSPIALNFGYDFALLTPFFWDTLYVKNI